jgi:hypothetical protein
VMFDVLGCAEGWAVDIRPTYGLAAQPPSRTLERY